MWPQLHDGQTLVLDTALPQVGDVAVARYGDKEIIKRVIDIEDDRFWLEGDNPGASTDSRNFGWIDKRAILGTMKFALPVAVDPPKLRDRRAARLGWVAAAVIIGFALVHLFRIDTFVPELALALGGDRSWAMWLAALIVIMEVFALPFLMRMRLSKLAQYISGGLAIAVPLVWLLIAIWTFETGVSTAQLGEFMALPSTWLLLAVNFIWLAFSYYTVWALGYDYRPGERQSFVSRWLSRLSK